MKIAYDPQIFCIQNYGGVSRYYCEIASRIARVPDVKVFITAPLHVNAYLSDVPSGIVFGFPAPKIDRFLTSNGVNYPRLALRGLNLLISNVMLNVLKPDIIHETYYSPYRLGARRARRVLTIYDMIHEKFASNFPLAVKTARYKALAAERADHVICISESTRRDVMEILGLSSDKISVIHLGFDLMNKAEAHAKEVILPTSEPFLLYVGDRGGYKNFIRLLEVYASSPHLNTAFKLVCFGGGTFRVEELKMMKALGLDNRQVIQLGGSDLLLSKLYENASALVYPSLYEGFGISPLEAMSHNCPVVCGRTSSIPEVVGDAGEYFDPADTESMRVAIERVISSDSQRKLLIARGRERLGYFSWDRCAAETFNVYKKLA